MFRNKNILLWTEKTFSRASKTYIMYISLHSNSAKKNIFLKGTSFAVPIRSTIFCKNQCELTFHSGENMPSKIKYI
jgi:hypothetical protein